MSEFTSFLPAVKMTVSGVDYTIPIWDLLVSAEPFSGAGTIAQENFDGVIEQRIDGWKLIADFQMNMKHDGLDHGNWADMIRAVVDATSVTLDFDPVDNAGTKTGTFVLENPGTLLAARFARSIRNRPVQATFVGTQILASIPSWISA